jgi:hypothetical protein
VVHLRELLILALIVTLITPLVEAVSDRTELINSSANSLNSLIANEFVQKKSTAHEQWISSRDIPTEVRIASAEYSKEMALQQLSDLSLNLYYTKDYTTIGDSPPGLIMKQSTKHDSIPDIQNANNNFDYLYRTNYEGDPSLAPIEGSNSELLHNIDQNLDFLYSQAISYPSIENIRIASSYSTSDVMKNLDSLHGRIDNRYGPTQVGLIENSDSHNEINDNLNYLYNMGASKNAQTARFNDASKFAQSSKYRYEKKSELGYNENLNSNIMFEAPRRKVQDRNAVIEFPARDSVPSNISFDHENLRSGVEYGDNELNIRAFDLKIRSDIHSNLNHLFNEIPQTDLAYAQDASPPHKYYSIFDNLEELIQNDNSRVKMSNIIPLDRIGDRPNKQNYAIVIGIDNYVDRRSLHSSVNDANMFAAMLEMYGYRVTKITDETPFKPTKYNILEGALAEIENNKEDCGNVIIYFSGHGDMDAKGNYFLLPQDANGSESTYISKDELNNHIKDIKNLAIIIDACNSGALGDLASRDQLILASSEAEEPSNEEWMGSQSVFTKNLCDAIRNEMALKGRVQLQKCFAEAQSNTIRWGNTRFLSQTPNLTDRTSGEFYLN